MDAGVGVMCSLHRILAIRVTPYPIKKSWGEHCYNAKAERWVYKLAPNLTGKAQLAYAGMSSAEEGDYKALKEATGILKRYDINEEAYQ